MSRKSGSDLGYHREGPLDRIGTRSASAIHGYLAQSSSEYALRIVDRLTARSIQIATFPFSGRMVPEYELNEVREAIEGPYRLGDGESQRSVNPRRLHNVRVYLTEWNGRRNPKTVMIAEGERVSGYGRIELYVGGELLQVLSVRPNGDLIVGSCTYEINSPSEQRRENNLYTWRDRFQRRSRSKRPA